MEQHDQENKNNQVPLKYVVPIILGGGMFIGFSTALLHAAGVLWQRVTGYFSTVNLILLAIIWLLLVVITYFLGERFDALKHRAWKAGIVIAAILFSLGGGIAMHLGRSWYYSPFDRGSPGTPAPTVVYRSVPVPYPVYTPPAVPDYPYAEYEQGRVERCRAICRPLIGYTWDAVEPYNNYSQCISNCCESDN